VQATPPHKLGVPATEHTETLVPAGKRTCLTPKLPCTLCLSQVIASGWGPARVPPASSLTPSFFSQFNESLKLPVAAAFLLAHVKLPRPGCFFVLASCLLLFESHSLPLALSHSPSHDSTRQLFLHFWSRPRRLQTQPGCFVISLGARVAVPSQAPQSPSSQGASSSSACLSRLSTAAHHGNLWNTKGLPSCLATAGVLFGWRLKRDRQHFTAPLS
jgi:hypothetical protein